MSDINSNNTTEQLGNHNNLTIITTNVYGNAASEESNSDLEENSNWNNLKNASYNFNYKRAKYYLISGTNHPKTINLKNLGYVSWHMVIDFNRDSEQNGLYAQTKEVFEQNRVIHNFVRPMKLLSMPALPWFFANGQSDVDISSSDLSYKEWKRLHDKQFQEQLNYIAEDLNPKDGIFIVYGFNDQKFINNIVESLHGLLDQSAHIVIIGNSNIHIPEDYEDICKIIVIDDESISNGLNSLFSDKYFIQSKRYFIPKGDTHTEISVKNANWFAEDLFVVYRELFVEEEAENAIQYRKGHKITWNNIVQHHDCNRDIARQLQDKLKQYLNQKQVSRTNLYHEPGAGGTTVSHRVAWELKDEYPICFLTNYNSDSTYRKIGQIYNLSKKSILLIVDRESFTDTQIDDLYEKLRAEGYPSVILQVIRKFDIVKHDKSSTKSNFYLYEELSIPEIASFKSAYQSEALTNKKSDLEKYVLSNDIKSAFFFGLVAYDDEYKGIDNYINSRFLYLTESQKYFFLYLAVAQYYGQTSLPIEIFRKHFGIKNIDLQKLFSGDSNVALDLVETKNGEIYIIHFAIAKKIFENLFGAQWKQQLSTIGKEFIDLCHSDLPIQSNKMIELMTKIFINRDRNALSNEKFSKILEDISVNEGKLIVLEHLSEKYPNNPHFLAHYGRMLSLNKDFPRAKEALKEALSLQNDDHVLHHIYGMIFYSHMLSIEPNEDSIKEIISLAGSAVDAFENARLYMPNDEHSYVGEISLYVKLFDKIHRATGQSTVEYIRIKQDNFLENAFDKASSLIDELELVYGADSRSEKFYVLRNQVHRLYGNFEIALQEFDSMLNSPSANINKNVIRRNIAHTLLERNNRNWERLDQKVLSRIVLLLTENVNSDVRDTQSIKMWIRAVRESGITQFSLDSIIEKIAHMKVNTDFIDAIYYLYAYHAVNLMEGALGSLESVRLNLGELENRTRFRRDRRFKYEWYGKNGGVNRLVHYSKIRDDDEEKELQNMRQNLTLLSGRIQKILTPERGFIDINGMSIYFNPAKYGFEIGRDESKIINFYVGFTYDGPVAENVH
ncbi:MAG: hypothetical protein Q8R86_03500 [Sulfuricurvum sp.]|nr:hypothetical protein [Sulfuricurvum sp.]